MNETNGVGKKNGMQKLEVELWCRGMVELRGRGWQKDEEGGGWKMQAVGKKMMG